MTRRSKAYLKVGIGALILLAKLSGPKPYFWSWETAEGLGYNTAGLVFIGIAIWFMISGGMDMRKGAGN